MSPDPLPPPREEPLPVLPESLDVAVLGAGPAGLLASIEAAQVQPHLTIAVFERRPFAGGQVPVAGGGRCNVTNAGPLEALMAGFGRDGRWLEPALRAFDNAATLRWFERRGVPMKEEEGGKMFPASDDGADVQRALVREAEGSRVKIYLRTRIERVEVEAGSVKGIVVEGRVIPSGAVVVAAGGSGPKPTPTSGVALAAALGHRVVPPAPALAPVKVTGRPFEPLAGVSASVRLSAGPVGFPVKRPRVSKVGILLFTHFGISGPVVLDLSHPIARLAARGPSELSINVVPGIPDVRAEVDRWSREQGAKAVSNVPVPGVPRRLFEFLIERAGVPAERKCAELRSEERAAVARILTDWRVADFEVTWAGAMVSGGGVALTEVDPKTMESRRVKGLYFAGETLDLQGDCGGYNLQASFSTGALAGTCAAQRAARLRTLGT